MEQITANNTIPYTFRNNIPYTLNTGRPDGYKFQPCLIKKKKKEEEAAVK
jgi:hypothetical protein